MATDLDPSGNPVQIGGITIRTPGLAGTVDVRQSSVADARSAAPTDTSALTGALERENVQQAQVIEISDPHEVDVSAAPVRSTSSGEPGIEIEVPHPGDSFGQLMLHTDESGITSWLFARDVSNKIDVSRGSATQTFVIPRHVAPSGSTEGKVRGLTWSVGSKLLKLLVFPLLDPLIGKVAEGFAHNWEAKNRPYQIRTFTDQNYSSPPEGPNVQGPDWTALAKGRTLLMIHGTFSQAHTGFAGLPAEYVSQLNQQYQGRVIAFDHLTLSETPTQNVQWFLQQMPDGTVLDVDIVCHSRGGLVARVFTEKLEQLAFGGRGLRIHNVVFVATPNAGTILTDPNHWNDYVDAYTNVLNFFPDNGVTEILQAIITVVKQLAVGALHGLEGLESMRPPPDGLYLKDFLDIGSKGNTNYFALASNYQPTELGLKLLHARLADTIFEQNNDLIVPTAGVYTANASGFPIDQHYVFEPPDEVPHDGYFSNDQARQKIVTWLSTS